MGHLDAAAGVTGVIKTALSLRAKTLPGLLHFESLNPNIESAGSPFRFSGETSPWPADGPRRAGVSAFGVGGVNAHVVLEEAPARVHAAVPPQRQVLCVSARTEAAPRPRLHSSLSFLEANPAANLADVAYTLAVGRKEFGCRAAVGRSTLASRDARGRESQGGEPCT